jgi:DNA-binding NtrC family response regulator
MAPSSKHPVMVVDDEPDILFSLELLLRREFAVSTAPGGAQALEVLREHPVHVILTDQRMPGMTGVELLERSRAVCPQAVRIVFTGYADTRAVIDAINKGQVFRYLTKPWDPDDLRAVLHEACAEYDRAVECHRLLHELREQVAQGLALVRGRAEAASFVQAGEALLARLEQAVAHASDQTTPSAKH